MTIHHIALTVSDMNASKIFYKAILQPLGYNIHIDKDSFGSFHGQSPEILLYLANKNFMKSKNEIYSPGLHHIAFQVESNSVIDTVFKNASAIGATILDKPKYYENYASDYYALFILDPDGSKIEFMKSKLI